MYSLMIECFSDSFNSDTEQTYHLHQICWWHNW